jgi:hypothetical protein
VQVDHMGYTFPYDDVKPDFNSEVSGTISGENPSALRIYVGGREAGDGDGQHSSACYTCDSSSSAPSSSSTSSSFSAASTMLTKIIQSPPSTTDAIVECTEESVCTPEAEFSVTTTTIPVTVTVQESGETPPPIECEESCFADSDDSSPVEIVTEVVEYVTEVEIDTVTSVITRTTVITSEETGYYS